MTDVYVIRNQLGHYWGKSKAWVDGSEARAVMRSRHEDEAVNTLFELSSRDIELRGEVVTAQLSERGEPLIEPSDTPLPEQAGDDAEDGAVEEHPASEQQTDTPSDTAQQDARETTPGS